MKKIIGRIMSINGCGVTNNLSINIETSDEIRLEGIIGKDVEVCLLEEASKEKTAEEIIKGKTDDAFCEKSEASK